MMKGSEMCSLLQRLGVPVRKVQRRDGHYIADFHSIDLSVATDSAKVWAEKIREVVPDAVIINTHDTIASWRKELPVIYASVIFEMPK